MLCMSLTERTCWKNLPHETVDSRRVTSIEHNYILIRLFVTFSLEKKKMSCGCLLTAGGTLAVVLAVALLSLAGVVGKPLDAVDNDAPQSLGEMSITLSKPSEEEVGPPDSEIMNTFKG